MKKLEVRKSFKGDKFKYGSREAIVTTLFLSILILLNLIVGRLNLSMDLTKNKMFTISEQTTKILSGLKQEVKIYGFYETGQENLSVATLLKQYKSSSKNISVEYKDPAKYPQIAELYSSEDVKVAVGFLVVESGSKYKVIDPESFVNYNYADPTSPTAESIAVEQSITSSILNVTTDKSTTIHTLQGHSEAKISSELTKQLEGLFSKQNFETILQGIGTLHPLKQEEIYGPGTADLIWIFHNRFFPVKLVLNELANLMAATKSIWVDLKELKERILD